MPTYEIPLSPNPQRFGITLAGVAYRMTVRYRDADMGGWILDISDTNENPIIAGIPLVTGADLLAQYATLGFGGVLFVTTDGDLDAVPTFNDLGVLNHLWFAVP